MDLLPHPLHSLFAVGEFTAIRPVCGRNYFAFTGRSPRGFLLPDFWWRRRPPWTCLGGGTQASLLIDTEEWREEAQRAAQGFQEAGCWGTGNNIVVIEAEESSRFFVAAEGKPLKNVQ